MAAVTVRTWRGASRTPGPASGRSGSAIDYVYNQTDGDGTVIGLFANNFVLAKLLTPSLRYRPEKFTWLARADSTGLFGLVSKKSGVTSVEDAKKRDVIIASTGAKHHGCDGAMGVEPVDRHTLQGVDRLQITTSPPWYWSAVKATVWGAVSLEFLDQKPLWLKEDVVKLIYLDDLKRDPAHPDVPTIPELATNQGDRAVLHLIASSSVIERSFVAAPGIPAERAKLRQAFEAMLKDPLYLQSAKERNFRVDPMSAAELEKVFRDIAATPESIFKTATTATQAPR